jgi:hypothetical protein
MTEPIWRSVKAPADDSPLQFGIRDLLIAQVICAVCLGLFAMIGIFALLAIFVATLAFCGIRVRPARAKLKRCIVDLLGGILLPAMCLVYDPGIFRDTRASDLAIVAVVAIVSQMAVLAIWMIAGRFLGCWNALFGGMLTVGAAVAGAIALALSPISLLGLLAYGIGLLGLTPYLTCVVFWRNARDALRQAAGPGSKWEVRVLFAVGFLLAAASPFLIAYCFGPWIVVAMHSMPQPHEMWRVGVFGDL